MSSQVHDNDRVEACSRSCDFLAGGERAQKTEYRVTNNSQESQRRRPRDVPSDRTSQQYAAYQRSQSNAGLMQPAVWVESSLSKAVPSSLRSKAVSQSATNRQASTSERDSEGFDAARSPRQAMNGATPSREELYKARSRDSSYNIRRSQNGAVRDMQRLSPPQSMEPAEDWTQVDSGTLKGSPVLHA